MQILCPACFLCWHMAELISERHNGGAQRAPRVPAVRAVLVASARSRCAQPRPARGSAPARGCRGCGRVLRCPGRTGGAQR